MISGLILAALLSSSSPALLDGGDLQGAMKATKAEAAKPSLAGRRFRVAIPFVDGGRRDLKSLQSPARYDYDRRSGELQLTIGLGQISPDNYDEFQQQGLEALPPLQTAVFDSSQFQDSFQYVNYNNKGNYLLEDGVRNVTTAYGLAVPHAEDGSALPPGFEPLMTRTVSVPQSEVQARTDGLTLLIEGEVTELGQAPATFCGDYHGDVQVVDARQATRYRLVAHQCFVTARIDKVTVQGGDLTTLASWASPRR